MQSTGLANHFGWKQRSSYTLAAEHLRWGILSCTLLPTYRLSRGKSQAETISSSLSARCKRVALGSNEGFILMDVVTAMDVCLGRTRTADVRVHLGQAESNSIYSTAPTTLYLPMVVASFPPRWKLQCSFANFPYNFLLLSQAILASLSRSDWILDSCCLAEDDIGSSSQNVGSCLSSLFS